MAVAETSLPRLYDPTPEIEAAVETFVAAEAEWQGTIRSGRSLTPAYREGRDRYREAWLALQKTIPVRRGWYRIGDRLWGWTKQSKCGLELTDRPASCPLMPR